MIVTMLTAMYMVVRVVEKIGVRFARRDPPLPFVVTQVLPWQVHHVSQKRRSSATAEYDGQRRNSLGVFRKNSTCSNGCAAAPLGLTLPVEKAAATIQNQFRKYQQKKKETK
ncbi:uncharacterized protein LOC118395328 isoform X2 [Oncorhynchus keta]|uniref:uncharacterized protein LOC118395328 isoform X2 n=1 Tax=Oncorhynchus keta TaxID=8018 RepID=UPI0015FC61DC|nr:uncharacterized protein LOC118395328 isoform X2 [Oncorhynchus keta]